MIEEMLTAHEAAEVLGYNVQHVRRLLREGTMKAERFNRVWLVPASEVERIKRLQGARGRLPRSSPQ